jgi:hypothetical protein
MTLPASIRINVTAPFPALVVGTGPITLEKANGIWSVGFSIDRLAYVVPAPAALASDFLIAYDSAARTFFKLTLADVAAAANVSTPSYDSAAGTYNVTNETVLLIDKLIPAAHNIQLPAAAARNGVPIVIKDFAGVCGDPTKIATILPGAGEMIDGLAALPVNSNYGGFNLVPIATGGWYISP